MIWSNVFGSTNVPYPPCPSRCLQHHAILVTSLTSVAGAQTDQTGSIAGRVVDDQGAPLAGAQVAIPGTTIGTQTRANGEYVLPRVPVGTHSLQGRHARIPARVGTGAAFQPTSAPLMTLPSGAIRSSSRPWW